MTVRYFLRLPDPSLARGSEPALSFRSDGAEGFAEELQAALRTDALFQKWKAMPVRTLVAAMAPKTPGTPSIWLPRAARGTCTSASLTKIIMNERFGIPIALNADPQPGTRLPGA